MHDDEQKKKVYEKLVWMANNKTKGNQKKIDIKVQTGLTKMMEYISYQLKTGKDPNNSDFNALGNNEIFYGSFFLLKEVCREAKKQYDANKGVDLLNDDGSKIYEKEAY